MRCPFHLPYLHGEEQLYIQDAIEKNRLSSDGFYQNKSEELIKQITQANEVLLTSSCTHALEVCALLLDIEEGDEVIMSSYNFSSVANAFVLRGAKIVFVDIRPDTMNIDETKIEPAITSHTKAIVVMHYGGVGCNMTVIKKLAEKHNLFVVEDAAHCIDAQYENQHLGTLGHLGTISFHSTKNIHCGEGGALLINDERFLKRAEIIREKGTNRKAFMHGEVDKYSWVDKGSSYVMSELNAAFLFCQLKNIATVTSNLLEIWNKYFQSINPELIETANFESSHNGHIFYIKCADQNERIHLIKYLKSREIKASFHYIPLHSSLAGKKFGKFFGQDQYTTKESNRLLRLPIYFDFKEVEYVVESIHNFVQKK